MAFIQRIRRFFYNLTAGEREVVHYRNFPSPSPVLIRGEITVGTRNENVVQFPARVLKQASG
jgi:hypothetical protein